ncbi:MAG: hypothetical protein CVT83_00905 [Alphaproteobacteria bacterium HGW-Alphaproteobacteria-5]|nr:MAG: hypothetical protein CVT83_00905 [Alphaproteobacteria bacterium HGW-Alphaproteobacteria-5]
MSKALRRHIRHETVINFSINACINGLLAWWLLKQKAMLSLWGQEGFAVDLVVTGFIMLLILASIVVPLNRRKMTRGVLSAHQWDAGSTLQNLLRKLPRRLPLVALCFALFGALVAAPLTIFVLQAVSVTELTPMNYSIFKAVWAGALSALMIAPLIRLATAPQEA